MFFDGIFTGYDNSSSPIRHPLKNKTSKGSNLVKVRANGAVDRRVELGSGSRRESADNVWDADGSTVGPWGLQR